MCTRARSRCASGASSLQFNTNVSSGLTAGDSTYNGSPTCRTSHSVHLDVNRIRTAFVAALCVENQKSNTFLLLFKDIGFNYLLPLNNAPIVVFNSSSSRAELKQINATIYTIPINNKTQKEKKISKPTRFLSTAQRRPTTRPELNHGHDDEPPPWQPPPCADR